MSKTTPKLGTAYPLRIGKTLRNGPRSLLSLRFTHVPNNTKLTQSGCLTRQQDKCTISLSTADGQGVVFSGPRSTKTAVSDYALVFVNGAMWLERADDVFPGLRPTLGQAMDVPVGAGDDVRGDPDSWMVEESGSPVTPEGNEGEEERRPRLGGGSTGGKSVATKTVAHKGLPNGNGVNHDTALSSSEEDDSDNNSDSDDSDSDSSNEYTDRSSDEDDD